MAQVVIAVVAVYLATRANRVNQDSHFVGDVVATLRGLQARSQKVRRLHRKLFEDFKALTDKRETREEWLSEREDVDATIRELTAYTWIAPVKVAWEHVEGFEDPHTVNDTLKVTDPQAAQRAIERYNHANYDFVTKISEAIAAVRRDGLGRKK